ncbi:MAG: serine/threonine-protein kinase [Actinomycetota bacterium]
METLNLGIGGLDNVELIGRGGSSRVYRATQVELDRTIALKVLQAGDDPNVVRRFDRERKAMGRLSLNEGIVPVYSTGVTDHGEPYLIMPYYEDGSLQDRMADGPVPWREAVEYVTQAAKTMTAAHEMGVVHLDLKPANILLSSDKRPRIADFGIAKLVNDPGTATNTGSAFTPTYSSPEVLLGGQATAASDVYGLAATLWALLAGRPPFRSENGEDNSLMAVVGRVVHSPIENLRHLAPDEVCAVVELGMSKDPEERYPTAGAFAEALAEATTAAASRESRDVAPIPPADLDQTTSLLTFEQAVPPKFEPATAAPRSVLDSPAAARTGMVVAIGVASFAVVGAVIVIASLLSAGSSATSDDEPTEVSTGLGDASSSDDDLSTNDSNEPSGPVLSSVTSPSTTSTETSATTTPTIGQTPTSGSGTTDTTSSSTSETTDTTGSTSSNTTDTTTSTSSSDTTDTTTSTSSSETTETSTSSSSTETTDSTTTTTSEEASLTPGPVPGLD